MTTNEKTIAKMTKKQKFEALLKISAVAENEMLVEFIKHELDLLAKKNSAERKPTSTQVVNEGLKEIILEFMEINRFYSISEMIKSCPELAELSNQKVASLIRQLILDNKVVKTMDKRKAYFSKVG